MTGIEPAVYVSFPDEGAPSADDICHVCVSHAPHKSRSRCRIPCGSLVQNQMGLYTQFVRNRCRDAGHGQCHAKTDSTKAPHVQVREANSKISALPLSYVPEDGGIRTRDP
jgi:hypothetical protein